ncbi:hypothetical protein [Streptomyces sp. NPDC056308]|uniref:hypothetical protein n=1 Tax=Streptomyces sp. NPDC056308 TaxID=3345780 RepID=UPI0035D9AB86
MSAPADFGLRGCAEPVEVTVRNGVVDVSGRMAEADGPRLLAEVENIDDVTEVIDHLNPVRG